MYGRLVLSKIYSIQTFLYYCINIQRIKIWAQITFLFFLPFSEFSHILCRGEYFQIRDHAGNTVYQYNYHLRDKFIQVPSGGKVTIQFKLMSNADSSVSGHFAVLNKSIDSGKDIFTNKIHGGDCWFVQKLYSYGCVLLRLFCLDWTLQFAIYDC